MIGGNLKATLQIKEGSKNDVGSFVVSWTYISDIIGWLDLSGGDSKQGTFNAKIQESTHIFVCDYIELPPKLKPENVRMVINGNVYDILLIDDPMELHAQLEFYLKYTGG